MRTARMAMMAILILSFLPVATASITFNSPTVPLAALAGQGYIYLPSCTFDSLTQELSTGLTKFAAFKIADATWSYIGFSADTLGNTMTITSLSTFQLIFDVNAAGVYRVWSTVFGMPSSVTGGSYTWDPALSITTITTVGVSTVTMNWASVGTNSGALIFVGVLALIVVIPFIWRRRS
jgi:hypothetical protein